MAVEDSHKPDTCYMVRDAYRWLINRDMWIICSACGAEMYDFTGATCPCCSARVTHIFDHPDHETVRHVINEIQNGGNDGRE